jgi:putative ABC transport system ATP-binding protein
MIECKNIWKTYGSGEATTIALKNVFLKIEEGDFVVITGPSGCGKSTLLHILGLLDTPTKGEVYINGINTTKMNEDEKAIFRRKISGFIFQRFYLMNNLTVLENVSLPLLLDEKDKEYIEKRSLDLLEKLGLKDRAYHYPSQLSGGQRQRVAIARALTNNPKIIFADEPTGALDSKNGEIVMNILKKLNQEGITIVMVTHDPRYFKYGNKIIKMRDGEVIEVS